MEPKSAVEGTQRATLVAQEKAARQAAEREVQAELDLLRESIGASSILTLTPLVEEIMEKEEEAPMPAK